MQRHKIIPPPPVFTCLFLALQKRLTLNVAIMVFLKIGYLLFFLRSGMIATLMHAEAK